jgi:hypothetical protein
MILSQQHSQDAEIERQHHEAFQESLEEFVENAAHLWSWCDGEGGYVFDQIREALAKHQPWSVPSRPTPKGSRRPTIPGSLRRSVYERDGYACVTCGTQKDLTLDHIHPYSLGGEDTAENLQTMCRPHNASKGARV